MAEAKRTLEETTQVLNRFVADCKDLWQLEEILGQFDLFDAFNMTRDEVRHSAVLAWLLTPSKPHGLGDRFLKKFLINATMLNESEYLTDVLRIDGIDADNAEIRTEVVIDEKKRIDILIVDPDPEDHLVCVVENKIDSAEHDDQTVAYREWVEKEYPESGSHKWLKLFVFLTPAPYETLAIRGKKISDKYYVNMTYQDIVNILAEIRELREDSIPPGPKMIIDQFILNLRRRIIMDDQRIRDLVKEIYRKHKPAIDIILEYFPNYNAYVLNEIEAELKNRLKLEGWTIRTTSSYIHLFPNEWIERFRCSYNTKCPFIRYEFRVYPNSINLLFLVADIHESSREIFEKSDFLEKLLGNLEKNLNNDSGVNLVKGKKDASTVTIFSDKICSLTDEIAAEDIANIAEEKFKRVLKEFHVIVEKTISELNDTKK